MNYFSSEDNINNFTNYSKTSMSSSSPSSWSRSWQDSQVFSTSGSNIFCKGFSSTCNVINYERRTSWPRNHSCPSLKRLIQFLCDPSVERLDTQCINDSLIKFNGGSTKALIINFIISLLGGTFKLLASVSLLIPSWAKQSWCASVQLVLKVFHETSAMTFYWCLSCCICRSPMLTILV